jgi:hypothetical protein
MSDHTAPDGVSTWDVEGAARRPGLTDCGNAALVNHATKPPPKNGTFPEAGWLNQLQRLAAAMGKMVANAKLTIDFDGGSPEIVTIQTPGDNLTALSFDVIDDGDGITTIEWEEGVLPPVTCDPELTINATGNNSGNVVKQGDRSFQVETRQGGVLTNLRFTISIN